jgi:hypothetical protein
LAYIDDAFELLATKYRAAELVDGVTRPVVMIHWLSCDASATLSQGSILRAGGAMNSGATELLIVSPRIRSISALAGASSRSAAN